MKAKLHYVIACAAASAIAFAPLAASSGEISTAPSDEKSAPESSQQNKMKYCNVEAGKKELKGEERRSFMSDCLRKK